jgi:SAM-dependent methyltransferase
MTASTRWYDAEQLRRMSELTIAHYDRSAKAYWVGTRDHDVNQNYAALLDAIEGDPPYSILDLGCGPGRDLRYFRSLGHDVVGLDGSTEFVAMARSYSECEVLQQDFLAMKLPESRFDGIFANASLFHVPSQELPRVLAELSANLRSRGVLFCSNPSGNNEEGFGGDRYSCFLRSRHLARLRHRSRVLAGEALLPPAGTAAPQAVVARDRLAQGGKVRRTSRAKRV